MPGTLLVWQLLLKWGLLPSSSLERVRWPLVFEHENLLGILRLSELLTAGPKATLRELCIPRAVVFDQSSVADALSAIAEACGSPSGFAMVLNRTSREFAGLLDGSHVLENMLTGTREDSVPNARVGPLSDAAAAGVVAALTARVCATTVNGSVPVASAAATDGPAGVDHRKVDATTSTDDLAYLVPDLVPQPEDVLPNNGTAPAPAHESPIGDVIQTQSAEAAEPDDEGALADALREV
jgi:hypothetical protein